MPRNQKALNELENILIRAGVPQDEGSSILNRKTLKKYKKELKEKGLDLDNEKPNFPGFKSYAALFEHFEGNLQDSTETVNSFNNDESKEAEIYRQPWVPPSSDMFPHYDKEIEIYPNEFKFETVGDAIRWGVIGLGNRLSRIYREKAEFIFHDDKEDYNNFVYPLKEKDGVAKVALFSDWGTGYYHSKYIAKHIGDMKPGQAIHLGDVYYDGTKKYFKENFSPIIDKYLLKKTRFYALNANHEMAVGGKPYFNYLKNKFNKGKNKPYIKQFQRGSYFCLENKHFQVIGLDTAYEWDFNDDDPLNDILGIDGDMYYPGGRYPNEKLRQWLRERIQAGKGKIRIVLSQNEAFSKSETDLFKDMKPFMRYFHFWFWGDEHYCALFKPSKNNREIPFWGSCIGHGGYPYTISEIPNLSNAPAKTLWVENEKRFWFDRNLRQDVGNNGFCMLELEEGAVRLQYIDWVKQLRSEFHFEMKNGKLVKTVQKKNINQILD